MADYNHKKIEKKWQTYWAKKKIYATKDSSTKPKAYVLDMFPYPSGDGLHVGHPKGYIATDIFSRHKRMSGFNVLHPMGWDAFGLPAENYAIKNKIHPRKAVEKNIKRFKQQLEIIGFDYDWSREINTTDPEYYRWTQWIFLQLYKKGLAEQSFEPINWCPSCQTGLANEDLEDGKCERCGSVVEKRPMRQWVLKITKYADRLLNDLGDVKWPEYIKESQRNWIGRSEGAELEFDVKPEKNTTFYQFFGSGKIREDKPWVERNAIMALVKHWKEDKYIGLKWKKVDWETLITGGVEGNQTPVEAAMAEVREETGYKNLKLIKDLGIADSRFFHVPKDQNRFGHFSMFVFQLENDERIDLDDKEKDIHEVVWLSKKDMETFGFPSSHRYLWDTYQNGKPIEYKIKVFTTRPDTIFGATYVVLAPEHPLVKHFIHQSSNSAEIDEYLKKAAKKSEIDRTAENKEKTGIELKGIKAINPATKEEIPVYVADYVLAHYGTGAIMAVPAHDERDYDFAKKYKLPVKTVIESFVRKEDGSDAVQSDKPFVERNAVVCIVKHWSEDKFLCSKWKSNDWQGFVIGGIEDGEDPAQAAEREVVEETGYTSPKFIKKLGTIHSQFYHDVKKVNRNGHFTVVYLELQNRNQNPVSEEEQKLHEVHWIDRKQVRDYLNRKDLKISWDMLSPDFVFSDAGVLVNSGQFSGLHSEEAKKKITSAVGGKIVTTYKLRDWVFSRQRYWGEPIPIIHCEKCGIVPVPEKDLPVKLPEVKHYEPTGTGESPLAAISKWVNVTCPQCKSPAKRETNTMPQWAGSSWYYVRYEDPKNKKALVDPKREKYWSPVDMYVGGAEHATRHLIYARFWHKFLFDIGIVHHKEPFMRLQNVGLILAEDGRKMSKRWGNVINPDDIVDRFGADTMRVYEMFMGPFNQNVAWSTDSTVGARRFIERVWRLRDKVDKKYVSPKHDGLETEINKLIIKVGNDIEDFKFNTAISHMMIFVNLLEKEERINQGHYVTFLKILAPFAPHITEELWAGLANKKSIHIEDWPKTDESKIKAELATIVIQVNGKVRGEFKGSQTMTQKEAETEALALPEIQKWVAQKAIKKVIFVPGRLINIVVI